MEESLGDRNLHRQGSGVPHEKENPDVLKELYAC
jgi:hypothetical protein